MRGSNALFALILIVLPLMGAAQQLGYEVAQDPVQVASLNRDRLIAESAYGSALMGALSTRQQQLVSENEALLAELEREERALTDTRKTMTAEEFTPLAEAFDAKVNAIRADQDAKALALAKDLENMRFGFFREVEPVIIEVMRDRGVTFLLNEQAVMLSTGEADLTNAVLARLDQMYADGTLGTKP